MAPGLSAAEKAARGKLPTDVWWHTIVSPTGREKTGYPTQKPLGVLRRIVQASSREGDWCLDFFAGSGTLGAAALELGRRCVLCDSSPEAAEVMRAPARAAGAATAGGRRRRARDQPTSRRLSGRARPSIATRSEWLQSVVAGFSVRDLVEARGGESLSSGARRSTRSSRACSKTIGFDRTWVRGEGAYLWDDQGDRYLDLIGGFGMFNVGRNNPRVRAALIEALELDLPGLGAARHLAAAAAPRRGAARADAAAARARALHEQRHRGGRGGAQARPRRDRPRRGSSTPTTASTG